MQPGGPAGGGGNGSGGDTFAVLASAINVLGTGRPALPVGLFLTMATTSTVVGASLAFGLFGKRRRDGEQPDSDEVLAAQAASGLSMVAAGTLAGVAPAHEAAVPQGEMAMPRWRRPSLLEARKADPDPRRHGRPTPDLRSRSRRRPRRSRAPPDPL